MSIYKTQVWSNLISPGNAFIQVAKCSFCHWTVNQDIYDNVFRLEWVSGNNFVFWVWYHSECGSHDLQLKEIVQLVVLAQTQCHRSILSRHSQKYLSARTNVRHGEVQQIIPSDRLAKTFSSSRKWPQLGTLPQGLMKSHKRRDSSYPEGADRSDLHRTVAKYHIATGASYSVSLL